ncbi:uncharacterized protein LOC120840462 [Ixodes scapularis]|uniref:uncharacterized protein LOC120840462 n=1 Tax=Ixodes scapularis TaxID=6945 RepID=UPI001A9D0357|nr:uncharacterized protein LOC120840462 [Ixodes scapularis]
MTRETRSKTPGSSLSEANSEPDAGNSGGGQSPDSDDLSAEITLMKLKIDLEKIKLEQLKITGQPHEESTRGVGGVGRYAKELRAVLAPMPVTDTLVPAWFKSAETMLASCEVPQDLHGAILLPFLNEKASAVVANRAEGRVLKYRELRDIILDELRMTPDEYKRRFNVARKQENESWAQFSTNLSTMYGYYMESRKVETLDDLRQLTISDRLKHAMPDDVRAYVLQNETKEWLRPKEVAGLAEKFEESRHNRNWRPQRLAEKPQVNLRGGPAKVGGDQRRIEKPRPQGCFACGKLGHFKQNCPGLAHRAVDSGNKSASAGLSARAALLPQSRETLETAGTRRHGETGSGISWVQLTAGGTPFSACLDSGADITVVRREVVPEESRRRGGGEIMLRGAFGQTVTAELRYVPLGLCTADGGTGQHVAVLCAVTERLAQGVDALLTPDAFEELTRANAESAEQAEQVQRLEAEIRAEQDQVSGNPPLEFEEVVEGIDSAGSTCDVDLVETVTERSATETGFASEQRDDGSLQGSWEQARSGTHGMLIEGNLLYHTEQIDGKECKQLVLPKPRREEVLQLAHDMPCGGHFSQKKTKQRIRNSFFWPTMAADVKRYCQSCHGCQIFAREMATDRVPITPLTRPERPFETVFMDCIGPMEPCTARGHRYALAVVDLCTRWPEVIPLRSLTAKSTCQALVDVFSRHGVPELICCDQGTNFTSQLTKELLSRLGVEIRFSTPDHPQSNGIVERWNGTFKAMLRHVVSERGGCWDQYVPCLLWAYREVPNEVTGRSPFELMYGREPQGPLSILKRTWTGQWTPPLGLNRPAAKYLKDLRERMVDSARVVDEHARAKQQAYAHRYNLRARPKEFTVGERVLVLETGLSGKLQPKWSGPAVIKERKRADSYIVDCPERGDRWVHANKLRRYVARAQNVGVIFESDEEFGDVESVPANNAHHATIEEITHDSPHLGADQRVELATLLRKFRKVFSEKPGRSVVGVHKIALVAEAKPVKSYPYRVPIALRKAVEDQETLATVPTLAAPDMSKEFILTTDASEHAVGACLSQESQEGEKPIAFLSKKLTAAQSKWSAVEREAFAVVWALGRLDTWLFGSKKYDVEISHIKGSLNTCADALSRLDRIE